MKDLNRVPRLLFLVLFLALLVSCKKESASSPEGGREPDLQSELVVAVDPELFAAMKDAAEDFDKSHPAGVKLVPLADENRQEMEQSAHLMAGISEARANALTKIIPQWTEAGYLSDPLVVAVRKDASFRVRSIRSLQQPIIRRIALPESGHPAGRLARDLLDWWKVTELVGRRLEETATPRKALALLEKGRVEAAIVPARLLLNDDSVQKAQNLSVRPHQDLRLVLLYRMGEKGHVAARDFADYLLADGREHFTSKGWSVNRADR